MRLITIIIVFLFSSVVAFAAPKLITPEEAVNAAGASLTGKVLLLGVDLDMYKQAVVYNVALLNSRDKLVVVLVDAETGTVVRDKFEKRLKYKASVLRQVKITHAQAAASATAIQNGKVIKSSLSAKSGKPLYEMDIVADNGYVYEAFVDGIDGSVLAVKQDEFFFIKPRLSVAQANDIATGAMSGLVLYTELDENDGRLYYEVTIVSDNYKLYKVKVDANKGEIMRMDMQK